MLAHDGDQVHSRCEVADTGIAISAGQRQRIADGFTQAEASISRRFGGPGMGLVLCRHLVGPRAAASSSTAVPVPATASGSISRRARRRAGPR